MEGENNKILNHPNYEYSDSNTHTHIYISNMELVGPQNINVHDLDLNLYRFIHGMHMHIVVL